MTLRPRVIVTELDEPVDLDRFVKRYVELALEAEGVASSAGHEREGRGTMGAERPTPVARSS